MPRELLISMPRELLTSSLPVTLTAELEGEDIKVAFEGEWDRVMLRPGERLIIHREGAAIVVSVGAALRRSSS